MQNFRKFVIISLSFLVVSSVYGAEAVPVSEELIVFSPSSLGRTPKVSFALSQEEIKNPGKIHPVHAAEHKKNKLSRNLMQVVTSDAIEAFYALTEPQLQHEISEIIPLPQALQMSEGKLYEQIALANPEELTKIFSDTALMAGEVSTDIFDRFFNVVCLNKAILEQYKNWLYTRLIPAITTLLNNRVMNIERNIKEEHAQYLAILQIEQEKYGAAMTDQEQIIHNAVQNEITTLAVVPVVAYVQSRLYESRAIRWISYAAFAGLTVQMLHQYGQILQRATRNKQESGRLKGVVAKVQIQAQTLQLPKIKIVDEVTGRLVRELYARITNFTNFEHDRLKNDLEKIEKRKRLFLEEISDEEQVSIPEVVLAGSAKKSFVQNPVVRKVLRVTKSFADLVSLFQAEL